MNFLSPSALWFLAAVSLPIIIHFLSHLRINKVEFSTIQFIKQLETSSIRKIKLQKIILLILRVLAIVCLVFMMAKPVTKGFISGWLAAEQDARLVIVIDNSASMNVKDGDQTFLEKSKNEARTLTPIFNEDTRITLAQTCPPEILFQGSSHNPDFEKSINSIETTVIHDEIWGKINKLLASDDNGESVKECIIFSDFMYKPDSSFLEGVSGLKDWKFYLVEPGTVYDNLSIKSVASLNRIKTLSQLVKLNTRIENSGQLPKPNIPLELLFNDHRVGQVVSEFKPGKEKEFLFQAYPSQMGIVHGKIQLPKDDYELDNRWYLSMPIMEQIRCGIIGSNNDDIAIFEMVLRAIDPNNEFLSIDSRLQPSINRLFLDDLDVAIIHNPKSITESGVEDLEKFLKLGGGVIWFQGDDDKNNFHINLFNNIGFPVPEIMINAGQGFFFTEIAGDHSDIFQDLQVRNMKNELPEVFTYLNVKSNLKQKNHWTLNNGDPLLMEFSKGSGKIFYFSTLLDLRWNDLAIRGMLVPLMYRLLVLTGTDEINTSSVQINSPKWISVKERNLRNKWEVVSPSGKREMIAPDYDKEGILITTTDELGIYSVFSNGELFSSFPTRLHGLEYIKRRISEEELEPILSSNQTKWLTMEGNFAQVFSETRHGKYLWKIFLTLAIMLLLAETIIGRPELFKMKSDEK